jgi:hypothetical protein
MRIRLLRRRAGLTITPWFQSRELILVFVFFTPEVGFPPQMTLVFISGTRRSYLEQKLLTDGRVEPRLYGTDRLEQVIRAPPERGVSEVSA